MEFLNLTVIKEDHTLRKLTWIVLTIDLVVIVVVIIAMTLALSACSPTPPPQPTPQAPRTNTFKNVLNATFTQYDWDHDHYQCRRENTHESINIGSGKPYIDETTVWLCLRAKGWRKV